MAVPTAPLDICLLALDKLKEAPIATISPPTTAQESKVARAYDHARRKVLRKYVWNFAWKTAAISRAGTPTYDFPDMYLRNSDDIRLLSIGGDREEWKTKRFRLSGRYVLVDASGADSINSRYIRDEEDISIWDELAKEILILTLAVDLCQGIVGKEKLLATLNTLLAAELPDAISIDGQESPIFRIQESKYLARRKGYYSSQLTSGYWTAFQ